MTEIALVIIVLLALVSVMSLIEHRVKTQGALFTGTPTRSMRMLALVLGIASAGLFLAELITSSTIHFLFPILAVALIGYALGAGALLRTLQGDRGSQEGSKSETPLSNTEEPPREPSGPMESSFLANRVSRFLIIFGAVLALSIAAFYAAVWAVTHPENPISIAFVIGIILLFVLLRVYRWYKAFKG